MVRACASNKCYLDEGNSEALEDLKANDDFLIREGREGEVFPSFIPKLESIQLRLRKQPIAPARR